MWKLPKNKDQPIYLMIKDLLLSYIQQGLLLPGEKLPPERKMAESFEVNRSTVVHALDELVAIGVIIRRQGSGTFVNDGKWGIFTDPGTNWHQYLNQNQFNLSEPFNDRVQELLRDPSPELIDAYTGELPLDLVPSHEFPSLSWNDFLKEEDQDQLGYYPLRKVIADQVSVDYELSLRPEQLMITSGGQQAIYLILQVLLSPGDAVVIEQPSFFYTLPLFQAAGIRLYGVPMDGEGIQIEGLKERILQKKIRMVLLNPNFQNPTGITMSEKRRHEVVELCRFHQIPIVEDDAFGQLYFSDQVRLPPLKKLDPDNVLYIGSLSKILGSTTRIGWLSAPVAVLNQLAQARNLMDASLSIFPQVLANWTIRDEHFEAELHKLRMELAQRAKRLSDGLDQKLWEVEVPSGGYYLWVKWRGAKLKRKFYDDLLQAELLIAPGFLFGSTEDALRINFARLTPAATERLLAGLASCTNKWNASEVPDS